MSPLNSLDQIEIQAHSGTLDFTTCTTQISLKSLHD